MTLTEGGFIGRGVLALGIYFVPAECAFSSTRAVLRRLASHPRPYCSSTLCSARLVGPPQASVAVGVGASGSHLGQSGARDAADSVVVVHALPTQRAGES